MCCGHAYLCSQYARPIRSRWPAFADRKRDSAKGCTDGEKLIAQRCLRAIYATLIFGLRSQEMPRVLRVDRSSRVRRLWKCRWTGYPYHDHHRLRQGPMDATKHPEHCFEEGFAWMGSGQSCQAPIRRKRCLWTKPLCPPRVKHGRCQFRTIARRLRNNETFYSGGVVVKNWFFLRPDGPIQSLCTRSDKQDAYSREKAFTPERFR